MEEVVKKLEEREKCDVKYLPLILHPYMRTLDVDMFTSGTITDQLLSGVIHCFPMVRNNYFINVFFYYFIARVTSVQWPWHCP